MKHSLEKIIFGLVVLITPAISFALSPLMQYNDLVAGEGDPGFEDGIFYEAQFYYPLGLTLNTNGSVLYVADRNNNRIRWVDLDHKNEVHTLAGTGENGRLDGPISKAQFSYPRGLAVLSDNQIAVNEGDDDGRIRLIDLATQKVSTIAGGGNSPVDGDGRKMQLSNIWNLAYRSADNCLYFSQPAAGVVRRLNLKTGLVETVLKANPLLPHPAALCVVGDKLYGADQDLENVYAITGLEAKPQKLAPAPTVTPGVSISDLIVPVTLQPVGKAHKIIALAGTGSSLYAYEGEAVSQSSIVRLFPDPDTLSFGTVWGEAIAKASDLLPHFSAVGAGWPVGFVSDSRSDGRFYVSNPSGSIVASFRDLRFGNLLSNGISCEFTYPKKKPYKTFRILLCGRSAIYFQIDKSWDGKEKTNYTTNIMMLVSKKLELLLNTQAALNDVPVHFEVLNDGRIIDSMVYVWPYYEMPKMVQDYDVDLVMVMMDAGNSNMAQFLYAPMTSEGIPAERFQQGFNKGKLITGSLRAFFDLCQKKKFLTIEKNDQWDLVPFKQMISDKEIENQAEDLVGRPMGLSTLR